MNRKQDGLINYFRTGPGLDRGNQTVLKTELTKNLEGQDWTRGNLNFKKTEVELFFAKDRTRTATGVTFLLQISNGGPEKHNRTDFI